MSKVVTLNGVDRIHKAAKSCRRLGTVKMESLDGEDYTVCLDSVADDGVVSGSTDQVQVLDSEFVPVPKKRGRPKGVYGERRRSKSPKSFVKSAKKASIKKCDVNTAYYSKIKSGKFKGQFRCRCNVIGNHRYLADKHCVSAGAERDAVKSDRIDSELKSYRKSAKAARLENKRQKALKKFDKQK